MNRFCRNCKQELSNINWTKANQNLGNYICSDCNNRQRRTKAATKRPIKDTNKYCNDCKVLLKSKVNWKIYNVNNNVNLCNDCYSQYRKKKWSDNKEENSKKWASYREKYKENYNRRCREKYAANKEHSRKKGRDYYAKNRDTIKSRNSSASSKQKRREWRKAQSDSNPSFKIRHAISNSIRIHLLSSSSTKNGESFLKFLPFSIEEIRSHIESLFENWMSWSNWGKYSPEDWDDNDQSTWTWQLDHIIPHSDFHYSSMEDESFKKCWALENLRPLSAKINLLDGVKRIRHKKENNDTNN